MQIGDKVWICDRNHRIFHDDKGNVLDRAWYRGYFVEHYIVGETKVSWIVGRFKEDAPDDRSNIKVNKKSLTYKAEYGRDGRLYLSEEEVDQVCWINDNRYKIKERVSVCNDYNKLKQITEILDEE